MMLGGLSLYAVVTGAITSVFVAQAQRRVQGDPVVERLDELADQLRKLQENVARAERGGE